LWQTKVGEALAELRYEGADLSKLPKSEAQPFTDPGTYLDDPLEKTIPCYSIKGISEPDTVVVYNINKTINATGQQKWQVNDSAFRGNYNNPLMLLTQQGNISHPDDRELNVYDFSKNKTVRMILKNYSPSGNPSFTRKFTPRYSQLSGDRQFSLCIFTAMTFLSYLKVSVVGMASHQSVPAAPCAVIPSWCPVVDT
jgi:hypothetical protein